MVDPKALQLIHKSMRRKLDAEEIAYCIQMGVLYEQKPLSHDEAILQIKQLAEIISFDKAAKAFLYSISSGDHCYRTALSSLIWAKSLSVHSCDQGKDFRGNSSCKICGMHMFAESDNLKFDMVKYSQDRLFPRKNFMDICCAGYVLNDLHEFVSLPEVEFAEEDIRILNRIFGLAKKMTPTNKVNALLKSISEDKLISIPANEAYSIMGVLASCGVFDTPEHKSYASGFVRCDKREFLYETDIYYPLHFWRGKHGIHYSAIYDTFERIASGKLSEDQAILGDVQREEKRRPSVSKAKQYFTDGVHIIDLTDKQRYYYGLSALDPDWDRMVIYSVTHSTKKRSEIFFEGERVKKLIYEEIVGADGYKLYLESDMDVATNKRQRVLPLTTRGREQNLTPSILKTPTHMNAQLQVLLNCRYTHFGTISFNSRNDQMLPLPPISLNTKEEFAQYTDKYISSCPDDYALQLDNFIHKRRALISFTAGDIFRVQLTPALYTYGLILGKVRQLETWTEIPQGHPMRYMMSQPLMIRQYSLITSNPQMTVQELENIPLLDMTFAQDSEIRWGTYPVVCHKKLDEEDIDLGFGINSQLKTIVWGLTMHAFTDAFWREIGFENVNNISVCKNGIDNSISLTYGVALSIPINHGDGNPGQIYRDNIVTDDHKNAVIRILGLNERNAYDDFAKRYGGLTRKQYIELLEARF